MAVTLFTVHCSLFISRVAAQDIIVNVTPVQQILPPQAMLYISQPGKYFNVSVTNTTQESQQIYLGLQIEQNTPTNNLAVSTPAYRMPTHPITVAATSTYQLTMVDLKNLWKDIPSQEIHATEGLVDNFFNGTFGLLPEGDYTAYLTAYRWDEKYGGRNYTNDIPTPIVLSNPASGTAHFTICYKAQPPEFLSPKVSFSSASSTATVHYQNAEFTWKPVTLNCAIAGAQFLYDFKVVELLPGQLPTDALGINSRSNPVVYESNGLMTPFCTIPQNVITARFFEGKNYVAMVTARAQNSSSLLLNYVLIENEGRSDFVMFNIDLGKKDEGTTDKGEGDKGDEGGGDDGDKDDTLTDDASLKFTGDNQEDGFKALYNFRNPQIERPSWNYSRAHKVFINEDIDVEYRKAWLLGGEGNRADTLKIEYTIELFKGEKSEHGIKDAVKGKAIWSTKTYNLRDTILWADIEEKVKKNDYLVLRVKPTCKNNIAEEDVTFENDEVNVVDFIMSERSSSKYFQCSNMIELDNFENTSKSATDYKGKTISIGEYKLTIDEINDSKLKKGTFEGKGHVEWKPLGFRTMVAVKFDSLAINTDDVVCGGVAYSYPDEASSSESDAKIVDELFSEWGIDNLIGDGSTPFSQLGGAAKDAAKSLADELDISQYYKWIKTGKAGVDMFLKGEVTDLHLPLAIPKDINSSPVDIQIGTMKFSAQYATMDLIAEFQLPGSDYVKEDILLLGAPRVCISPNRVLPESGHIALLDNFTIVDPKSKYECKFKAPADLITPEDGCYVSWHANKFEIFEIDVDMKIPKLKRVDSMTDKAINEMPTLNFTASMDYHGWDGLHASVSMEPFEYEGLPGWKFTASDIEWDHSFWWDPAGLTFPKGYDKSHIPTDEDYAGKGWTGLSIKTLELAFPKGLLGGDERLAIGGYNMLFDASGPTCEVGLKKLVDLSLDGWTLKVNEILVKILQKKFNGSHINGQFHVPLTGKDEMIDFACYMHPQENTSNPGAIDFVLKITQQMDLNFDFWLAEATLDSKQSYFLLEAIDQGQGKGYDTTVELCMAGKMGIGGTEGSKWKNKINSYLGKLPMKPKIPDIHFNQMRLSNKERDKWKSVYEQKLRDDAQQAAADEGKKGELLKLTTNKTMKLGEKCFFDVGNWSLASFSKDLGPFRLSLTDYGLQQTGENVALTFTGDIGLVMKDSKNALISVGCTFGINAKVDMKNFEIAFNDNIGCHGITFNDIKLNVEAAGLTFNGTLHIADGSGTGIDKNKGYSGDITIKLPGDLMVLQCKGGYFNHTSSGSSDNGGKDYSWGYFHAKAGSKMGIPIAPITIKGIEAGVYFNCAKNYTKEEEPKAKYGAIGVIAGITMATSDGQLIQDSEFKVTAAYDKTANKGKGRLSTFMFNGHIKGVSGMVDADASIVWYEDDNDKYFQLNVTVDVSADGCMKELSGLASKLKDVDEKFSMETIKKNAQSALTGNGLDDKVGDNKKEVSDKDSNAKDNYSEKQKKANAMSAHVELDFRLTFRKDGKDFDKCKWHVYLGEPAEDKRCRLELINMKTGIVDVKIGATMYLCFGNELPNDGELPPIPTEVSTFLNGQSKGGMEGGDLNKANNARKQAVKDFKSNVTGGVMLGASVYGFVNVRLGIFYGAMGAIAGFDVSIRHWDNPQCFDPTGKNAKGEFGYKGWYGEGQLYAYLYATFGITINLGFWSHDFPVIDAGIGGVLKCALPNPNYFVGQARIKLKLLGGLVNVNRKFSFECGRVCSIFYGNPLDNFELFGECTLGVPAKKEGWAKDAELVDPNLTSKPIYETQAPLDAGFRVLDENSLHELEKDWDGDREQLEMQAKRTFIFRRKSSAFLYEMSAMPDTTTFNKVISRSTIGNWPAEASKLHLVSIGSLATTDLSQTSHILQVTKLNPNRYYAIVVRGTAKEIIKGQEENPRTYHDDPDWPKGKDRWTQDPWVQTQAYYFRTGGAQAVEDEVDLQDYVALAYPSNRGKLFSNEFVNAYAEDIYSPTIALKEDISAKAFKKGYLYWNLYELVRTSSRGAHTRNLLCQTSNVYLSTPNTVNMAPYPYSDWKTKAQASTSNLFVITLEYWTWQDVEETQKVVDHYRTVIVSDQRMANTLSRVLGRRVKVGEKVNVPVYKTKTVTVRKLQPTNTLAQLNLQRVDGNWRYGYQKTRDYRERVDYERPFVGVRTLMAYDKYGLWSNYPYNTDAILADNDNSQVGSAKAPYRMVSPFFYMGCLANYFFIGGHGITNYSFETMEDGAGYAVPVAESFIYYNKGRVFNGNLDPYSPWNAWYGAVNIRNNSLPYYADHSSIPYPLPIIKDEEYQWANQMVITGQNEYVYELLPSTVNRSRFIYALWDLANPFFLAQEIGRKMNWVSAQDPDKSWYSVVSPSGWYTHFGSGDKLKRAMQQFNNTYRGVYCNMYFEWFKDHNKRYAGSTGSGSSSDDPNVVQRVEAKVPMYQFPLVFGGQFPNNKDHKKKCLHQSVPGISNSDRKHQEISTRMFIRNFEYCSGENPKGITGTYERFDAKKTLKAINSVNFYTYRVNAFDYKNLTYTCVNMPNISSCVENVTLYNPYEEWGDEYTNDLETAKKAK